MAIPDWLRRSARRMPVLGRLLGERDRLAEQRDTLAALAGQIAQARTYVLAQRSAGTLLLDVRCPVDFHVYSHDDWEGDRIAAMMAAARQFERDPRRKVFLDIGALWGLYALHADRTGLFDRIVCFEPDPTNAAQLAAQLFLNDAAHRIEFDRRAASDRTGPGWFEGSGVQPKGNRGAARITGESAGAIPVDCVRIDDAIDITGAVVFIKLDVEGHETAALAGMMDLLAGNEVYLQAEAFPERREALFALVPARLVHRWSEGVDHVFSTFDLDPAASRPTRSAT